MNRMKGYYEILDSLYDGIWICDNEGRVIYLNKASEKLNRLKAKQAIGKSVVELMEEGRFDRSVTLPVLESRKTFTIVANTKSGKDVLLTGSPVFHQNGGIKLSDNHLSPGIKGNLGRDTISCSTSGSRVLKGTTFLRKSNTCGRG